MKIATAALSTLIAIVMLIGGIGQAVVEALFGSSSTQPSQEALADIPGDYLALYRQATSVCPGLDWSILAAIGKIETDHGGSTLPGVHSEENESRSPLPLERRRLRRRHPPRGRGFIALDRVRGPRLAC